MQHLFFIRCTQNVELENYGKRRNSGPLSTKTSIQVQNSGTEQMKTGNYLSCNIFRIDYQVIMVKLWNPFSKHSQWVYENQTPSSSYLKQNVNPLLRFHFQSWRQECKNWQNKSNGSHTVLKQGIYFSTFESAQNPKRIGKSLCSFKLLTIIYLTFTGLTICLKC